MQGKKKKFPSPPSLDPQCRLLLIACLIFCQKAYHVSMRLVLLLFPFYRWGNQGLLHVLTLTSRWAVSLRWSPGSLPAGHVLLPTAWGSFVLSHTSSHAGFHSLTRDRTHVPCFARWILNHWPPGKSPQSHVLTLFPFFFSHWNHILVWSLLYSLNTPGKFSFSYTEI